MNPRPTTSHLFAQADESDEVTAAAGRALLREVDSTITLDPALEAGAEHADHMEPGA